MTINSTENKETFPPRKVTFSKALLSYDVNTHVTMLSKRATESVSDFLAVKAGPAVWPWRRDEGGVCQLVLQNKVERNLSSRTAASPPDASWKQGVSNTLFYLECFYCKRG